MILEPDITLLWTEIVQRLIAKPTLSFNCKTVEGFIGLGVFSATVYGDVPLVYLAWVLKANNYMHGDHYFSAFSKMGGYGFRLY